MLEVQRYIAEYHDWFYLITLVWTFFEGESFVILAGAVAAKGLLDPTALIASAWLGSWLGDQCWFFIGRYFGLRLLRRFPEWRGGIERIHGWIERWEVLFILSFRFIYGIRNFSSAALGLSGINTYRFLALNFVSAGLWASSFVGAGYLFGEAIEHLLGRWGTEIELGVLGGVAAIAVIAWAANRLRRRRPSDAATSAEATRAARVATVAAEPRRD